MSGIDRAATDRSAPSADTASPDGGADQLPTTVEATLERMDGAWAEFRSLAGGYPPERVDEHIGRGWTRKQMLAHVAAWHDITADRLMAFAKTGEPQPLEEDDDVVNGRVARAATGRTAGEVMDVLDSSYRRLRRQVSLLDDDQLTPHDGWAPRVIASNTYEHYADHRADLDVTAGEGAAPPGR